MEQEKEVEIPDLDGPAYKVVKLESQEVREVDAFIDALLKAHQPVS